MLKLPLPPAIYLLLATLAEGPAHGYRLRTELIERSDGALTLDPGSLYRLIARLLDENLIAETPNRSEASGGPPRRLYRLTPQGRRLLAAETSRLAGLVAHVQGALARKRPRET